MLTSYCGMNASSCSGTLIYFTSATPLDAPFFIQRSYHLAPALNTSSAISLNVRFSSVHILAASSLEYLSASALRQSVYFSFFML